MQVWPVYNFASVIPNITTKRKIKGGCSKPSGITFVISVIVNFNTKVNFSLRSQ